MRGFCAKAFTPPAQIWKRPPSFPSCTSDPVVAKETVQLELAKQYEKAGRKDEAVNVLFDLVKAASEAKDLEGKSVPLTQTAQSAKDKLKALDPEKAKEIPEPVPETPGGMPFGN